MEISGLGQAVVMTCDCKIRRHLLEWTGSSGYTSPTVGESVPELPFNLE